MIAVIRNRNIPARKKHIMNPKKKKNPDCVTNAYMRQPTAMASDAIIKLDLYDLLIFHLLRKMLYHTNPDKKHAWHASSNLIAC
jgi:hypothetical protein